MNAAAVRAASAAAWATLPLALCLAGQPAAAQVVRCTDAATGRTTYTDGTCPRGDGAREVLPQKSAEELARERQQADEALARWHERQRREDAERAAATRREADRPAPAPHSGQSAACQQARQQLQRLLAAPATGLHDDVLRLQAAERQADQACLPPEEFARAERSRALATPQAPVIVLPPTRPPHWRPPPPPAPAREITNCNVFRCYDRQGNVYPR